MKFKTNTIKTCDSLGIAIEKHMYLNVGTLIHVDVIKESDLKDKIDLTWKEFLYKLDSENCKLYSSGYYDNGVLAKFYDDGDSVFCENGKIRILTPSVLALTYIESKTNNKIIAGATEIVVELNYELYKIKDEEYPSIIEVKGIIKEFK